MNRIILALDTTDLKEAINISKKLKDKIFTVKLGLEFFNAHGKNGVEEFNNIGITNLMLDLKIKDIPETVYKSIKALEEKQTKEAVKKYGSKDSGGVLGEILGPLLKKKKKKTD